MRRTTKKKEGVYEKGGQHCQHILLDILLLSLNYLESDHLLGGGREKQAARCCYVYDR